MRRLRLVVLVSGRGSNLESLLQASKEGRMSADVVLVVSNKPDAPALEIAKRHGVAAKVVPGKGPDRDAHEALMMEAIDAAKPDLVALAGYMRILGPSFIQRYRGRLVNIHPSLLPAFPGLDAQGQAHRAGVRIAGCTTHFVTEEVDGGPIIAQRAVDVPPGCTLDDLRALILAEEHKLYPETIEMLASGKARLEGDRVVRA